VGTFGVTVTPRPGHSLTAIEALVDSIVARVAADGPTTDELTRAKAGNEFSLVSGLESPLAKAEILLAGQVYRGDPNAFQQDLRALQAVTAADVRRVAARYLTARRVVLSVVPLGKRELAAKPEASTPVGAAAAPAAAPAATSNAAEVRP
jgi:predicted Zn-dependent peptidase